MVENRDGPREQTAYEVAIWCTVLGENEEEVRDMVFQWCQHLKSLFEKKLVVKAVEVGLALQ